MGEYSDYSMNEPVSGRSVAGVCHARGENADLPAQWLVYVVVESLDASLRECLARGGSVVAGPKTRATGPTSPSSATRRGPSWHCINRYHSEDR